MVVVKRVVRDELGVDVLFCCCCCHCCFKPPSMLRNVAFECSLFFLFISLSFSLSQLTKNSANLQSYSRSE